MTKKEFANRPMFGFGPCSPSAAALYAGAPVPKAVLDEISKTPFARKLAADADKDAIIAELRAKIEALEAREMKRRVVSREAMRKKRAADRTG